MHKKGISINSVEKSLSHSADKIRRRTLLCSRKVLVSKNVRYKRGGEYHNFPSKIFCLTVPKISVGESFFTVALISGIEKVWIRGGGGGGWGVKIFCRKFFVSQCRKFP